MEILNDILSTTLTSFDFSFCISVNILTYLINKTLSDLSNKVISTWTKRLVLLGSIGVISLVWYIMNKDLTLIVNSAILSPVFWSWVVKPLFKKFDIDYNIK